MQTTRIDLAAQAAEVKRVLEGVRDDQLTDPTPCVGTSVAGLLDHLDGLTVAFRLAAEKSQLAGGPSADADDLAPDWRTKLPVQLDAMVAAWREPGAWEGMTEIAGLRMPGGTVGLIGLNEVLVHGWDLAVATGQEYRGDPVAAQACLEYVQDFAATAPEARNSIYAPVVPFPDDAPVLHRLLGATGRDPGWRP
jgi:uncharacterized protein (TIGR03086 family)